MMKNKVFAVTACVAAALVVTGGVAGTQTASADFGSSPVLRAGSGVMLGDGLSGLPQATGSTCTVAAVGTDSLGRRLGLTAGHCVPQGDNREVRLSWSNVRVGEFITEPTGFPDIYQQQPPDISRDGAFFLIDDGIEVSNTLPDGGKITAIGSTPHPTSPKFVCHFGQFTRGACGFMFREANNVVDSFIPSLPGDSGGPVHVNGVLVGVTSSFTAFSGIDGILADAATDGVTGFELLP